jgi:hypothetical protein
MTVSVTTNRVSAVGSGAVAQAVPFTFPIVATTDLAVYKRVTATGVETLLAETTNYTVTITGSTGGTVTTVTAIAATDEIHVIRVTPKTQALDLVASGSFSAENIEASIDKLCKQTIENTNAISRCLRLPNTDGADDVEIPSSVSRASSYISFDASGDVTTTTALLGTADTALVSAYGETLIDDADAPTALTTLGVSAFAQTVLDDADAVTARNTLGCVEALLSTTTVSLAVDGNTTLYTVPTGKTCVLTKAILIAGAGAGADMVCTISIGRSTSLADFIAACTLTNFDADGDAVILVPVPSTTPLKSKTYAATVIIQAAVNYTSGTATAVSKVYLFGYLY